MGLAGTAIGRGLSWLLLAIIAVLMIPLAVSNHLGHHNIARILTFGASGAITLAMIGSLIFLIHGIPEHREAPTALLRSAVVLWITNVLVFALWYWKLDAGGPVERERRHGPLGKFFPFPADVRAKTAAIRSWSPHFMDYLFLAFNTSTAFSPTDTAVLSRWAKAVTMLQSLISLTILALLAARAVNIL